MIVEDEPSSKKGVFLFVVGDHQRIHSRDILDFLNKHWDENSECTVPIVMIPPSLTLLEIGSIEATFSKAGYHKVRFFLYANNSLFVQELTFNEPIPRVSISWPVRPKL